MQLDWNNYYLAAISNDNCVYLTKLPINKLLATWATRMNIPVYTFYSENAYRIAKDASNGLPPIFDSAHKYLNNTNILRKGVFFDHWHTDKHLGHCLFGYPFINI